jgi:hypothetical protein
MKPRIASRLAWAVGTLSIALMAGGLVLMFVDRDAPLRALSATDSAWTFSTVLNDVVNMAVPTLGIVLAARRPETESAGCS